jgi:hypothetical protein
MFAAPRATLLGGSLRLKVIEGGRVTVNEGRVTKPLSIELVKAFGARRQSAIDILLLEEEHW